METREIFQTKKIMLKNVNDLPFTCSQKNIKNRSIENDDNDTNYIVVNYERETI